MKNIDICNQDIDTCSIDETVIHITAVSIVLFIIILIVFFIKQAGLAGFTEWTHDVHLEWKIIWKYADGNLVLYFLMNYLIIHFFTLPNQYNCVTTGEIVGSVLESFCVLLFAQAFLAAFALMGDMVMFGIIALFAIIFLLSILIQFW